jgi:transaldolase
MKLFVDTALLSEIQKCVAAGICDGVTTNPTINLAAGIGTQSEIEQRFIEIAEFIHPRPLCVEVTTDEPSEMVRQAHIYHGWSPNIVVKITITSRDGTSCLPVIHELYKEGIDVNATAMVTFNQAFLAAKAGAKYLSLFGGRIDDEGSDAVRVIGKMRTWLDWWGAACPKSPEIIVGSSRTTKNISDWALTGAHILTITPAIIDKLLVNARTKETVTQFIEDAGKALLTSSNSPKQ